MNVISYCYLNKKSYFVTLFVASYDVVDCGGRAA